MFAVETVNFKAKTPGSYCIQPMSWVCPRLSGHCKSVLS